MSSNIVDMETYKVMKDLDKMGEVISNIEMLAEKPAYENDVKTLQEILNIIKPITKMIEEKGFLNEN